MPRLVIVILLINSCLVAQEIDPSWFYRPGVTITQVHTFAPDETLFDVSQFGADQVWDFSNEPFNTLVDTTWFLDPSQMAFSENYPNATIGKRNVSPFYDWEWFYRIENDTIYSEGESFIRTFSNPPDSTILTLEGLNIVHMPSLLDLNETFVDSRSNPVTKTSFQGYGTVITRAQDTFPNCILLKSEFSAQGHVDYKWYQQDLTKEVAHFSNTGPDPALTRLVDYNDANPTLSKEISGADALDLHISYSEGNLIINKVFDNSFMQIQLYDISGRTLYSNTHQLSRGDNLIPMRIVSELSSVVVLIIDKQSGAFLCKQVLVY